MKRFINVPNALAGFALLCFLWYIGMRVPLEFVIHLGFGWLLFLMKVVPAVTVRWSAVATALAAFVLLFVGIHRLTAWFAQAKASAANLDEPAKGAKPVSAPAVWPWRWTILATSLVVLMFVSGIAVVGMAHQGAWMATSKEPMTESNVIQFRRTESVRHLGELGRALFEHHDKEGAFPAGGTFSPQGMPMHSWQTALLPYLGHQSLFDQIDRSAAWDDPRNHSVFKNPVTDFLNPVLVRGDGSSSELARSHYAGNGWVIGGGRALRREDISDGLSNTLLSGEVNSEFKSWGDPLNWRDPMRGINRVPDGFGSPFHVGVAFLLGDGSVRAVSSNIDPTVLKALATPNGGEPVEDY